MAQKQFVVCIDNEDNTAALELRKIYETLPDASAESIDLIRVIDESGEGYLYPSERFIRIDFSSEVQAAISKAA